MRSIPIGVQNRSAGILPALFRREKKKTVGKMPFAAQDKLALQIPIFRVHARSFGTPVLVRKLAFPVFFCWRKVQQPLMRPWWRENSWPKSQTSARFRSAVHVRSPEKCERRTLLSHFPLRRSIRGAGQPLPLRPSRVIGRDGPACPLGNCAKPPLLAFFRVAEP